ncbi:hypothetical protein [Sciscionella marina]|uniref:hypothetical protein n=1 Tax=Sciscionella marina TaxID=508770 RepID=UPI000373F923|nr:hypothetical protein [Sciscionella marina]
MTTMDTPVSEDKVRALLEQQSSAELRPAYEGCNISTSLGFKQINYLVEAAVLEHFRAAGLPAGGLYDRFGLGLDVVEIATRLPAHLHIDDVPKLTVTPDTRKGGLRFKVVATVQREGAEVTTSTSTVSAVLRRDSGATAPVPDGLHPFVADRIGGAEPRPLATEPAPRSELSAGRGTSTDPVLAELTQGQNAFGWRWRIPYFYCHFSERVQMSGFLRQMEEVVDLFLADRGLDIKRVLDGRHWIPVVTKSDVRLLDEVIMEEDLYTIYTVEDVFKGLLYTSRMDCYVVRDGAVVPVATGHITHGYMTKRKTGVWEMVTFDEETVAAFEGVNR